MHCGGEYLDVRLANDGHGRLPTHEGLARAVAGLSRVLAGNEDRCAAVLRHLTVARSS